MTDFSKLSRIHDAATKRKMDEYYDTHFPDTEDCAHCNCTILPDEQVGRDCHGDTICESCQDQFRIQAEVIHEQDR